MNIELFSKITQFAPLLDQVFNDTKPDRDAIIEKFKDTGLDLTRVLAMSYASSVLMELLEKKKIMFIS